ncbi:NAD(P)-dependent dehydrogenase (short-subunit alcohol dehydrogenase family) [Nonomuraea thailandensis]|uniref:NAD(P)-dependent dehydrogenase (Short-subunit alcohol dehydrogenase family) n=1 Tax=Nonomuraea thailandensis TaxID=1188745 RepID=A0A9X2GA38_9ACTN|nr:SDR family oxidoreductase [Nonomuraea thailandensis]MCP2353599.1 NAD(P)-dependent dehydrogenase (short-subunit alcohol dehydrogenase family) [Nonomuraea thailandensis]
MSDRLAVVTGAGGNIGAACARLLRRVADVVLCVDRDEERVAATVSALGRQGRMLVADATDAHFGTAIARSTALLGRAVAVVHAVAHEDHRSADELALSSLRQSLTVGPVAAFALFQQLKVTGCLARGAALTVIGSLHARLPFPGVLGYNAAHAALGQVVKTLAHEWAGDGVRVNAVAPGWIRTGGEVVLYGEERLDQAAAGLPFRRFGTPEEVADAVGFLSSDAAAYISGSTLTVDGALSVSMARLP